MKSIKRLLFLALALALALSLIACGGSDACTKHVDADKDAKCDTCGVAVECASCVDENKDAKCDVCGKDVACASCVDEDKNAKCDVCGKDVACAECVDEDADDKCDVCGKDMPVQEINTLVLIEDEIPNFQFVIANGIDTDVRKAVESTVIKGMQRKSGIEVKSVTEGFSDDEEMEIEVLVGDVKNRGAKYTMDRHELGKEGYVIKIIGTKIIINAGSDEALEEAVIEFAEDILDYENKKLEYAEMSKENVVIKPQTGYKVTSLSLDGADMKGYTIAAEISNADYKAAALTLQDAIYDRTGYWFEIIAKEDATDRSIVINHTEKVYNENSFKVAVSGTQLIVECAFDNKLSDALASFVLQKITTATGDVNFSGNVFNQDISYVTYEAFGAIGNGKVDDFEAIYKAHVFANISGQVVKAAAGKTYYMHNPVILAEGDKTASPKEIPIQTNVIWDGAYFIIDDSTISVLKGEHGSDFYNYNIFTVIPNTEHKLITLSASNGNGELIESLKGNINRSTTKINIPSSEIKDWEGDIMIIPYNSSHKVYRRRGYGGFEGGSMHEVIVVDKDGNVSAETPIMYDYTNINYIQVYRLDESSAITLQGGTFETKASSTNCVRTLANGSLDAYGGYINRGIEVSRSFTLVKDVKHKITGEIKLTEQVDASGNIIKCGAAYHGFFAANDANHVTFEDCELMGRRCFARPQGGTQGTYDLTGNEVNKIVFKNCIQTNFWVTVVDGSAVPATEDTPGAVPSMASYQVGTRNLKMHWGIGGTNYCKNMEYIGSTLSRFDAHAGLYNGKVIDSTVNYLAITGNGDFILHNTRYFAEGSGEGSNSLFHLRSDYGSTWEGNIDLKNVDAYVYTTGTVFLFYHTYTNWYYGYQACSPSISVDNLNYYSIASRQPLPEGYEISLTRGHITATSMLHLEESHTNAIFSILDQDPDGYCDTCHMVMKSTYPCETCTDYYGDGDCDKCLKAMNIEACEICIDADKDDRCDTCKAEFVLTTRCANGTCDGVDGDDYCDTCYAIIGSPECTKCADKGNGYVDEPLMDRDLDGVIDPPCDLDGDGVIGNTSLKYDDCYNADDDYTDGFASSVKVNLNMVRPPEFIKIINNDGVDTDGDGIGDTGGYVFKIRDTSTRGISNGGYWGAEENYGGFFGSTKFYYSETEYFQGTAHQDQTLTSTFKFFS